MFLLLIIWGGGLYFGPLFLPQKVQREGFASKATSSIWERMGKKKDMGTLGQGA